MSLRYRKRIKIADGLYINLAKNGFSSLSIGKPGMTVNLGKKTSGITFGLPGTGLSYKKRFSSQSKSNKKSESTDYQELATYAENELQRINKKRRNELNQLLSLNKEIVLTSSEKYWDDIVSKVTKKYAELKPFIVPLDSQSNIVKIAKAIKTSNYECLWIQNSHLHAGISLAGLISCPISIFGEIYVGTDMGIPDEELPIIGVNLEKIKISKLDSAWGQKSYFKFLLPYIGMLGCSYIATIYLVGFWITLFGLLGLIYSLYIAYTWFPTFINKAPFRAFSMIHALAQKSKDWTRELNEEKNTISQKVSTYRQSSLSGNYEDIIESIPLLTMGLENQSQVQINAAVDDNDTLCVLIQLPSKEGIEVKNKLTPGGRESVQEKSDKELNFEYATAVLNLSFYILTKAYSAFPTFSKIKLAGCVRRINESTGNKDIETILYFDSNKSEISDINFNDVNIIKLTEHLKYNITLEDNYYLTRLKVNDLNFDEMKEDFNSTEQAS
jgi:hypothetical protein